jgi:hypothetical protein
MSSFFSKEAIAKFAIDQFDKNEGNITDAVTKLYATNPDTVKQFATVLNKLTPIVNRIVNPVGGKRKHTRRTRRLVKHV